MEWFWAVFLFCVVVVIMGGQWLFNHPMSPEDIRQKLDACEKAGLAPYVEYDTWRKTNEKRYVVSIYCLPKEKSP